MYVKNEELTIHFETFDSNRDAPFLVLIFGFSMTLRDWIDFGYIEILRNQFKVIAVEPRGHGESSSPHDPDSYRLELMASDIQAVLDYLNISHAIIWGYSLGAKISLSMAESSAGRIKGMILGGLELHSKVDLSKDIVTDTLKLGGTAWRNLLQQQFDMPQSTAERFTCVNTKALLSLRQAEKDWPSMRDIPSQVRVPVLLYTGEHCYCRDEMKRMSRLFPNSRFFEKKDANHFQVMTAVKWICDKVIAYFSSR
ncbi:alpha/beta hydrolase [Kroppenstedtia pulmonis]|uniref:Alpha/beta hydrolase n=1 Tax=Kroppenstedtia pulmonis TaxID=1380685 RepID=A0A7D3Y1E5_9BACL|nr:alpha/beta fold hydrolase [Kroppenstedtia pulmonis]QKG84183.1 alpha/beta hydrolase [Kroppenstedtia pulmonis]